MQTPDTPTAKTPFDQGFTAGLIGLPRESCPFPAGSDEHTAWLAGWDYARKTLASESGSPGKS